jgi:methionyl-tRNA formyltransferase
MIPYLITHNVSPTPQKGEITIFKRRTYKDSNLPNLGSLREFYDFIRMLDAPNYPNAFIQKGKFKIKFKEAKLKENKVIGRFEIEEDSNNSSSS